MIYGLWLLTALPVAALWTFLDRKGMKRIERQVTQWIKNHSGRM